MAELGERRCEICNRIFRPKDPRHKTCFDCARKTKGIGEKGSSLNQSGLLERFNTYLNRLKEYGYFDEQGYLRPELRVADAEMVAKTLVDANVTTNQLRRFFTMSRGLEQRLDAGQSFSSIRTDIASLQPFAAALVGKEQNLWQRKKLEVLRGFIDTNAQVAGKSEKAFQKGFVPHFESVIAYFTYHKPKS